MQCHAGASAGSVYHSVTNGSNTSRTPVVHTSIAVFCLRTRHVPNAANAPYNGLALQQRICRRGCLTIETTLFCHPFEPDKAHTHHLKSRASACGPCEIKVCLLHATYMDDDAKLNHSEPAARRGARRKQRTEEESLGLTQTQFWAGMPQGTARVSTSPARTRHAGPQRRSQGRSSHHKPCADLHGPALTLYLHSSHRPDLNFPWAAWVHRARALGMSSSPNPPRLAPNCNPLQD